MAAGTLTRDRISDIKLLPSSSISRTESARGSKYEQHFLAQIFLLRNSKITE